VIEEILPAGIASAEAFGDPAALSLFPEEEARIARAVEKRRREFATVRLCARRALATLGVPPAPILPGERGAPQWPDGVVGSMTHCDGYRAAAVAPSVAVATIGIDAEPHAPLPDGILAHIALASEQALLAELGRDNPAVHWDRLLFCAKESVYKAWFPLARTWLGFEEADIVLRPDGTFSARLIATSTPSLAGRPLTGFDGRWLARRGLAITAISLRAAAA
jgi:4'-phosphopantetheinyl transferase EntD